MCYVVISTVLDQARTPKSMFSFTIFCWGTTRKTGYRPYSRRWPHTQPAHCTWHWNLFRYQHSIHPLCFSDHLLVWCLLGVNRDQSAKVTHNYHCIKNINLIAFNGDIAHSRQTHLPEEHPTSKVQMEIGGGRVECIDNGCRDMKTTSRWSCQKHQKHKRFNSILWLTVSKAAEMSNPINTVSCVLSIELYTL